VEFERKLVELFVQDDVFEEEAVIVGFDAMRKKIGRKANGVFGWRGSRRKKIKIF
jgi:hypothetical protein